MNKTIGQMTKVERDKAVKEACRQLQTDLDSPRWKAGVEKVLNEGRS